MKSEPMRPVSRNVNVGIRGTRIVCFHAISMLIALYSMLIEAGSVASGDVVNWVMFPDWVNSDYVGRGTSPELDVTTTFRLHDGEISVGNPRFITPGGRIADPNWPFENDQVPTFIAVPPGGLLRYTLTFTYTNPGGLPAGGSVLVGDLENTDCSIHVTGIRQGNPVEVNWEVLYFEAEGLTARYPSWDPTTNILQGIGLGSIPTVNYTILVSDVPLDEIQLDVENLVGQDGLLFNTTAQNIRYLPEPTTLIQVLTLLGLLAPRRLRNGSTIT